jgi:hypothetical protein
MTLATTSKARTIMLTKLRIALAATLLALAAVDSAAAGPIVRHEGLVAVVSDAPEDLRAKRRDLEAHDEVLEALSGP